jgi:hypothetical protein
MDHDFAVLRVIICRTYAAAGTFGIPRSCRRISLVASSSSWPLENHRALVGAAKAGVHTGMNEAQGIHDGHGLRAPQRIAKGSARNATARVLFHREPGEVREGHDYRCSDEKVRHSHD